MNGIIVVDKPAGFTSFDVVAKLRGICETRQTGHGGTLDPMATGVLPVFVGRTTKAVDLAPRQDKAYEAVVLLGAATDTGDVTGEILQRAPVPEIAPTALEEVLARFVGEQMQTPPMYSAVKVDGKPLYKYAREGKEVARKARQVTFHSLVLLGDEAIPRLCALSGQDMDTLLALADGNKQALFAFGVHCSKGTYVRTLVEDIGKALGVPATLAALRRTRAGMFALEDAHTLDEIQQAKDTGGAEGLEKLMRPVSQVFAQLPIYNVSAAEAKRLMNGVALRGRQFEVADACQIWEAPEDGTKRFLGLGKVPEEGTLRAVKLFVTEQPAPKAEAK